MYLAEEQAHIPRYQVDVAEPEPLLPLVPAPMPPSAAEEEQAYDHIKFNVMSDTVTLPSERMRAAMATAVCGDNVLGNDVPTMQLETLVAQLSGKESAIFLPSGTQSNQLALRALLGSHALPSSVLCDHRAHIYTSELGGIASNSHASTTPVVPSNGHHLTLDDVKKHANTVLSITAPRTRIISLENTLHGTIFPQDEIKRIATFARAHDIQLHLDGARLWNAAAETGMPLRDLCKPFDTVSLCLSKGIGAPIGSILVGPATVIGTVHYLRKMMGGGMRQTGVVAAAAHAALHETWPKLRATHALAQRVAAVLQSHGARILVPVETNMIFFRWDTSVLDEKVLVQQAAALDPPITLGTGRMVIHWQTDPSLPARLDALLRSII
ncbi:L-allo-threonine aldolase [Malassezia pachydermatis]|uniref:Threonine aldolase n=1 Tax=Malassezia pachydermatis TaxID=77020 RepID=A0A0M9VR97_9BASI|nr:threonine aldolase [Malassezia pachydermatis]KOS16392.1 threonine aldolase [Malassezia pachydermatis]